MGNCTIGRIHYQSPEAGIKTPTMLQVFAHKVSQLQSAWGTLQSGQTKSIGESRNRHSPNLTGEQQELGIDSGTICSGCHINEGWTRLSAMLASYRGPTVQGQFYSIF